MQANARVGSSDCTSGFDRFIERNRCTFWLAHIPRENGGERWREKEGQLTCTDTIAAQPRALASPRLGEYPGQLPVNEVLSHLQNKVGRQMPDELPAVLTETRGVPK